MNLKPYIESGILEMYVLGLLAEDEQKGVGRMLLVYPALKAELSAIEEALEIYAQKNAITPNAATGKLTLARIANLQKEKVMALNDLPLINEHSDYQNWLKLKANLKPIILTDGLHTQVLQHTDQVTQMLIVAEVNIPDEVHDLEHESFLILEGQCNCMINGQSTIMGPGDFMAIPLHANHDVALISTQVTAILQRVKI